MENRIKFPSKFFMPVPEVRILGDRYLKKSNDSETIAGNVSID